MDDTRDEFDEKIDGEELGTLGGDSLLADEDDPLAVLDAEEDEDELLNIHGLRVEEEEEPEL